MAAKWWFFILVISSTFISTLLCGRAFLSLIHSFIHSYIHAFMHSFISTCACGFLFDATGCNPLLSLFILLLKLLLSGRPFQLALLSFTHVSIIHWACPYFQAQDTAGPAFTHPFPALESVSSPRNRILFSWGWYPEIKIRAYSVLLAKRVSLHRYPVDPVKWTDLGNMYGMWYVHISI